MKLGFLYWIYPFILLVSCSSAGKITDSDKQHYSDAIAANQWVYTADRMTPQGGRTQNITSTYEVRLDQNVLTCQLPYAGRAHSGADVMSTQSPLDFKSEKFKIVKNNLGNGKWEVIIKPEDNNNVQSLQFNLHDNGTAYLYVTLSSRTPMSYDGRYGPLKK
jgi:Domain of unknown function (DUF4251)